MLQFKIKETTISVIDEGTVLIASRFIHSKLCRIMLKLEGTTKDLNVKALRVSKLDDTMFKEFDRIQKETNDDGES